MAARRVLPTPEPPPAPRHANTTSQLPIAARTPAKRRQQLATMPHPMSMSLAQHTRSKTKAATKLAAPQASNTRARSRKSLVPKPSAKLWQLTRWVKRIEKDVHQALTVMDKDSGKMFNYRQLMRQPNYKKQWSLISANEFGRLANVIGERTKIPTNTIKFIRKEDVPKDRRTYVTYGQFVYTVRPENAEKIVRDSL